MDSNRSWRSLILEYGVACSKRQPDIARTLWEEIEAALIEAAACVADLDNDERDYWPLLALSKEKQR